MKNGDEDDGKLGMIYGINGKFILFIVLFLPRVREVDVGSRA